MTRAPRWSDESGSAVVEFCVLGVLMLLPVVYLVIALGRIEAGALAVQGAAREAGRAYVTADDDAAGRARAQAAAALALSDQGFGSADHLRLAIDCAQGPCLAPDTRVEVQAALWVVLPGVPRVLDHVVPTRIQVTATHMVVVDRFRAESEPSP